MYTEEIFTNYLNRKSPL